jgi:hypothetical protein
MISLRGYILATAGRRNEAAEVLSTLEAIAHERYVPPYAFALIHAGLEHRERALEWLEHAYTVRDVILSGCLWMRDGTRSERSLRSPDSSNAAGSHGAHRRYSSFPCEYVNGRGQEFIDRGLTALARSPILGQDSVGCTTRNQLYLDQEVTRIWRPLASHDDRGIYQGSAHAAQELPTSGNCPPASSRRRCSRDLYKEANDHPG